MRRMFAGFLLSLIVCIGWHGDSACQSSGQDGITPGRIVVARSAAIKIDVILWFDTEDYILPASDDAALRLATWLSEQGIKATFKVVGEKARTLERRGRSDVIAALKKHEIGYHSNWHSVPPTPAQYLNEGGWEDGITEFTRREKPGFDDVARIFGQQPTCYGQPGSSWAPQTHAALKQWGVPIYLDAGSHVNLEGKPFWYGGILNFYKLTHQLRTGLLQPSDVDDAQRKFLAAREQLIKDKGGVVSIVYHPCEFVHKQFWDGVNFRKGANPPREAWQLPPMKSSAETRLAYANFEQYVLFIKRFPEVHFVTATEVARDYPDLAYQQEYSIRDVLQLSSLVKNQLQQGGLSWVKKDDCLFSPAEVFWLFSRALVDFESPGQESKRIRLPQSLWGPSRPSAVSSNLTTVSEKDLQRAGVEVLKYVEERKQIPNVVWIGSQGITPEHFLGLMTRSIYQRYCVLQKIENLSFPDELWKIELQTKKYVSDDGPQLWKWVIFPEGFHAANVMELAKRQAWTLKPAAFRPKP